MEVLIGLAGRYRKTSCWPSQEKLLQLLRQYTGRLMSRRTLCRHLNALERGLWVRRIRRHRRARSGALELHSTAYVPMQRYCQRLQRSAIGFARIVGAQMRAYGSRSIAVSLMAQNLTTTFKEVDTRAPPGP